MPRTICVLAFALLCSFCRASDLNESRIKREPVFEFTQKPKVTRVRDKVTINFESKGFCDVSVAIEDARGRIVRCLASGVLGKNAPPPFKKNSKKQTLIWDGKDDRGKYVEDKDNVTVRVSLGLKARFERTLFWTPKKRASNEPPIIVAAPEGVYVYDSGQSLDHVRLFDHKGNYVRTVYPFPSGVVNKVRGLYRHKFPQDGAMLPIKCNFLQTTMLSSGSNSEPVTYKPKSRTYESVAGGQPAHYGMFGRAALGMAVYPGGGPGKGGKIALAHRLLNRLGTDGGDAGGLIYGPMVSSPGHLRLVHSFPGGKFNIPPRSMAFSPDGKWLYMTGYYWAKPWNNDGLHGVKRMAFNSDKPSELFAGSMSQKEGGTDDKHLSYPASVVCDAKGRVYVADHMNDRIQVFDPSGRLLKSISSPKPAEIRIHPESGELYVFSWMIANYRLIGENKERKKLHKPEIHIKAILRHYGSYDNPRLIESWPLPVRDYEERPRHAYIANGSQFRAEIDFWAESLTIWLVPCGKGRGKWNHCGTLILKPKGKKLAVVRDFGKEVDKDPYGSHLSGGIRRRIYANPVSGRVYVTSGTSFQDVVRIDPKNGKHRTVNLPHNSEEMCFDYAGRAYLRSMSYVSRWDSRTWREIPWDYGEERKRVSFSSMSTARMGSIVSALPVFQGINWHMGGMHVSPRGHLVVACYTSKELELRTDTKQLGEQGKEYSPQIYPGRLITKKGALVHVWDSHGKMLREDAVPGLGDLYGVAIDKDNAIYVVSSGTRLIDGKRHFNDI